MHMLVFDKFFVICITKKKLAEIDRLLKPTLTKAVNNLTFRMENYVFTGLNGWPNP